jgi:serine/threonine-protein kinase
MGAVYEAEQVPTGQRLAVKVLPKVGTDRDIARRFEREAKAASLLNHPNIVEVLDFIALDADALFLVMELVRGVSLADRLEEGPIETTYALDIARQVLRALVDAHAIGVVHRDLKPNNIMLVASTSAVAGQETVKLIDFGIVKLVGDAAADVGGDRLTRTGVVFGTPEYLSPEQALGRPTDARADLYALGVILVEMLTGCRPFDSDDPVALLRMQVTSPPPTLAALAPQHHFAPELERLVERALKKRAEERFASASEMLAALETVAESLQLGRL